MPKILIGRKTYLSVWSLKNRNMQNINETKKDTVQLDRRTIKSIKLNILKKHKEDTNKTKITPLSWLNEEKAPKSTIKKIVRNIFHGTKNVWSVLRWK